MTPPRRWLVACALPVLIGALLTGCRKGHPATSAESAAAPVDVRVCLAASQGVSDWSEAPGAVEPLRRAELAAVVMARVADVSCSEGDTVDAGQVLVRLDARRAGAEASRAAAGVASARATAEQTRLQEQLERAGADSRLVKAEQDLAMGAGGARAEEKAQADEVVRQAQAAVATAAEQLDLLREGARRQERAGAGERVAQAEAAVRQAREQLSALEEGSRPQERGQAVAGVEQAEAQLVSAQSGLREVTGQRRAQAAEQVRMAEAAFETADATFRRLEALHEADVISTQRYDEARLAWEQARGQLAVARQESSLVSDGDSSESVVRARQAVDQARAAVKQAREAASLVDEGPRAQDVETQRARVRQAESALSEARAQASLVEEGPRSQQLRQAEEAVRQAEAGLTIARKQREMAYAGARPEEIRQLEEAYNAARTGLLATDVSRKQVEVAQAQLAYASAAASAASVVVDDHTIRAPFAGVVTKRMVDPGDMASPGIVLLVIEPVDRFRIHCDVPESQAKDVRLGDALPVELDSLPGEKVVATVSSIVPAADPSSRTFLIKADLLAHESLKSGLFGRLFLPVGRREGVVVDERCRWRNESLSGAWVVSDEGVARLRLARFADASPGLIEALTGIEAGDRVIVDPSPMLTDGAPATVIEELPLPMGLTVTAETQGGESQ